MEERRRFSIVLGQREDGIAAKQDDVNKTCVREKDAWWGAFVAPVSPNWEYKG